MVFAVVIVVIAIGGRLGSLTSHAYRQHEQGNPYEDQLSVIRQITLLPMLGWANTNHQQFAKLAQYQIKQQICTICNCADLKM